MNGRITNRSNLLAWLGQYYLSLEKQALGYPCRINKMLPNNSVRVQFSGQIDTIDVEIQKIIDTNLFEYFSPSDKKLIFFKNFNKQQFKVVGHYSDEKNTAMVLIEDLWTSEKIAIPASSLTSNNIAINKLSPGDANIIGFIAGSAINQKITSE